MPCIRCGLKLPSIKVRPTALAWPTTLTLTYDLDLQSPASFGRDSYTCKNPCQRLVGSKDRVKTNEGTDRTDRRTRPITLPFPLTRSVIKQKRARQSGHSTLWLLIIYTVVCSDSYMSITLLQRIPANRARLWTALTMSDRVSLCCRTQWNINLFCDALTDLLTSLCCFWLFSLHVIIVTASILLRKYMTWFWHIAVDNGSVDHVSKVISNIQQRSMCT